MEADGTGAGAGGGAGGAGGAGAVSAGGRSRFCACASCQTKLHAYRRWVGRKRAGEGRVGNGRDEHIQLRDLYGYIDRNRKNWDWNITDKSRL